MEEKRIYRLALLLIIVFFATSIVSVHLRSPPQQTQNNNHQLFVNSETDEKINLNKATKEELKSLPQIGEIKASKIKEYRRNKQIKSVYDLKEIDGIGDGTLKAIKKRVDS